MKQTWHRGSCGIVWASGGGGRFKFRKQESCVNQARSAWPQFHSHTQGDCTETAVAIPNDEPRAWESRPSLEKISRTHLSARNLVRWLNDRRGKRKKSTDQVRANAKKKKGGVYRLRAYSRTPFTWHCPHLSSHQLLSRKDKMRKKTEIRVQKADLTFNVSPSSIQTEAAEQQSKQAIPISHVLLSVSIEQVRPTLVQTLGDLRTRSRILKAFFEKKWQQRPCAQYQLLADRGTNSKYRTGRVDKEWKISLCSLPSVVANKWSDPQCRHSVLADTTDIPKLVWENESKISPSCHFFGELPVLICLIQPKKLQPAKATCHFDHENLQNKISRAEPNICPKESKRTDSTFPNRFSIPLPKTRHWKQKWHANGRSPPFSFCPSWSSSVPKVSLIPRHHHSGCPVLEVVRVVLSELAAKRLAKLPQASHRPTPSPPARPSFRAFSFLSWTELLSTHL